MGEHYNGIIKGLKATITATDMARVYLTNNGSLVDRKFCGVQLTRHIRCLPPTFAIALTVTRSALRVL